MKIFYRVFGAFMFVLILVAISNVLLGHNLVNTNSGVIDFASNSYPIILASAGAEKGGEELWLGTFIYASGDSVLGNQYIRDGEEGLSSNLNKLENLGLPVNELKIKYNAVLEAQREVIKKVDSNHNAEEEIRASLNLLQQRESMLNLELEILYNNAHSDTARSLKALQATAEKGDSIIGLNFIAFIILLLFTSLIAILLSTSISNSLNSLSDTVDSISKGNFKIKLKETSQIYELKRLTQTLSRIIKTMKLAALEKIDVVDHFSKSFEDNTGGGSDEDKSKPKK